MEINLFKIYINNIVCVAMWPLVVYSNYFYCKLASLVHQAHLRYIYFNTVYCIIIYYT